MAKGGVSFDLTDVYESDGGLEALPRGNYAAEIDETEYSESSNGNPMITCRYNVIDGEFEDRKLWDRMVLTEKALPVLKKKLRVTMEAQGLNSQFKKLMKKLDEDKFADLAESGDLIGAQVLLTVGVRTYEGEKRNDIKRVAALEDMEEGDDDFMDDYEPDDDVEDDEGEEENETTSKKAPAKKTARGKRR